MSDKKLFAAEELIKDRRVSEKQSRKKAIILTIIFTATLMIRLITNLPTTLLLWVEGILAGFYWICSFKYDESDADIRERCCDQCGTWLSYDEKTTTYSILRKESWEGKSYIGTTTKKEDVILEFTDNNNVERYVIGTKKTPEKQYVGLTHYEADLTINLICPKCNAVKTYNETFRSLDPFYYTDESTRKIIAEKFKNP